VFVGFRIKEQVIAVPEEVLAQMLQVDNEGQSEEGLTLVACRNLLSLMS
jgi:phytochrome A